MCNARKRERTSQECNLNVDRPKIHVKRIKLEQKQERKRITNMQSLLHSQMNN